MVNVVLKAGARPAVRRRHAPAPLLDGIRNGDWTSRPALARRLGAALAARGEIAYCVEGPDDRRALPAPSTTCSLNWPTFSGARLLRLAVGAPRDRAGLPDGDRPALKVAADLVEPDDPCDGSLGPRSSDRSQGKPSTCGGREF